VTYRIVVDRNTCIACGLAPSLCPQVFELGEDNGRNRVTNRYNEKTSEEKSVGVVPEDHYECVKEAAEACPVQAIAVEKIP